MNRLTRRLELAVPEPRVFPDENLGSGPDGRPWLPGLSSRMNVLAESEVAFARGEIRWEKITVVETHSDSFAPLAAWRPAVNAYRCSDQFVVLVELAGVPPESVAWSITGRHLVISGRRPRLEPACDRSSMAQVLALEIDHGDFSRVLDLPQNIDAARATARHEAGLLEIRLPLAG
jgi:HSP20 family protein